jgi:hypothetical protein
VTDAVTTIPVARLDDVAASFHEQALVAALDKLTAASERIRVLEEALRPFLELLALAQNGAVLNGNVTVLKQSAPAIWFDDARAALSHAESERSGG